ncbi:cytochrome P450 [Rhizodiscina lignyota]|uniref:Cytochrome P450 n=1 Tax=Rhizodiscina lignyota TaxID=1504668 RepID=A0A9P4M5E4_9PEZI|nr:cytochrome P450 [Rhizodiscina lignyota]
MSAIAVCASVALVYLIYHTLKIFRQYQKARATGFKVYVSILDTTNPIFTVFALPLLPILSRILPASAFRVIDLTTYGVEWRDKVVRRSRPTPGYMVASSSSELDLFVEDPEIAGAILTRWRDFQQDRMTFKFLGVVGPNLAASDGKDWQRQRRLIAPMLNERIMETVWGESVEQANEMLETFIGKDEGKTDGTVDGLRRIAFNVLQCIGYGMPQGWNEPAKAPQKGHKMVYMEALHELIEGLIIVAMVPAKVLAHSWMPAVLRRKGEAIYEFHNYTKELLQKEREISANSGTPRNNMLSLLSSISEQNSDSKERDSAQKNTLSDEEIRGNLYQFTLAGYDTTANTMAYAFVTLATLPKWQDWIIEEVDRVSATSPDSSYREIFPKLERCLALMHEILRIYTPVAHIVRGCESEQSITAGGKTYRIPAKTRCILSLDGLGTQAGYWGDNTFEFDPTRWLIKDKPNGIAVPPALRQPTKGAFIPWSGGPRICPGMKMAQVEFTSVVYSVFSKYRVEPVLKEGESEGDARKRLAAVMDDSQPKLTLQMNRPRDAVLKWTKR